MLLARRCISGDALTRFTSHARERARNDNVRFEIVYDVERFLVKLRHDVVLDDGRRVESTDATGFMHFQADPNSLLLGFLLEVHVPLPHRSQMLLPFAHAKSGMS